MVGIFTIVRSNLVAEYNIQTLPANYRAWARILLEYSRIRYALVTDVVLNHNMLQDCYCLATNSSAGEELAFSFRLGNRVIRITEHDLNRILLFPQDNFVQEPTPEQLAEFFTLTNYLDFDLSDLGEMYKHNLPKSWNFFFHTIIKCFSYKKSGCTVFLTFIKYWHMKQLII